jgi:hypothetical protein
MVARRLFTLRELARQVTAEGQGRWRVLRQLGVIIPAGRARGYYLLERMIVIICRTSHYLGRDFVPKWRPISRADSSPMHIQDAGPDVND